MPLPTQPIVNDLRPDRLRAILYGVPGAGKTSLAAGWFPAASLIIDVDGGTRFLPGAHFVERVGSFTEFMALANDLAAGGHQFTTVVIDTIDKLVRLADQEAGARYGKASAAEVEYGKGTGNRDATIFRELQKLLATDLGVILCAHRILVGGDEERKIAPSAYPRIESGETGDRLRLPIIGEFDFVLAVRKNADESRELVTGGDRDFETKRRVALPNVLPADPGALHAAIVAGVAEIQAVAA